MATAGIRSEAGDEFSGGALLPVAASLRWSRPDLTAGIAEHVAQRSLAEGDRPLWLAASGWYVHGRSATGDGRQAAADVVDRLRTMARRGALITSDGVRLCVELAGLAQENGDVADARALASVALEAADGSAELELDALVVLVRCALADHAKDIDELLARARTASTRLPGQGPAAVYALIMAAAHRAAGRCDDAVSAAVDGLRELGVLPSNEVGVALPGHLADALGSQWIGTLLDHDRVHEARSAAESISGARTGGIPSRQAVQLRLSIARATAGDVGSTRRGLVDAADMAAAADTPSLESACRAALAGLEEQAANVEAALASMSAGVTAERADQERGQRFRALLTTLGAPDSWQTAPSRREQQRDRGGEPRTGGRRRAAAGDDERRLVGVPGTAESTSGDRDETAGPTQAASAAAEPVAAEAPAPTPRRRRAAPESGAEGGARDVLRELLKGSPLGDALAAELRANGRLAQDGLAHGGHANGRVASRGRANGGSSSGDSETGGAADSGTAGGASKNGVQSSHGTRGGGSVGGASTSGAAKAPVVDGGAAGSAESGRAEGAISGNLRAESAGTESASAENGRAENGRAENGRAENGRAERSAGRSGATADTGIGSHRSPSGDARDSEAASGGLADSSIERPTYGAGAGRRSASVPDGTERNGHRATETPARDRPVADDAPAEESSSATAEGASDWLRAAIAELDRVWGPPSAPDNATPDNATPDNATPDSAAQISTGRALTAAEPTGPDATAPDTAPTNPAARHSSGSDAAHGVDAEQTSGELPAVKGGRATRHATSDPLASSEDLTSGYDPGGVGDPVGGLGSLGARDTSEGPADRDTVAGEELARTRFGSSVVLDLVRGDERMSSQAAQEALRGLTDRIREHLPVRARVRDDGPDQLVVVLPGHGRAATAAWLHPVLRELADHNDSAHGLAGARLRGTVHGTNGHTGVQLIQDIVTPAAPGRRRHATADDSYGLTGGGVTDGGVTDRGLTDGGSANDRQADDGQANGRRRTGEDARPEGDDAPRAATGRRARRRAAAGDPLGPASYTLSSSGFSGSSAEGSGSLLGDLLYRELSRAATETPVAGLAGSATDGGDTPVGPRAGRLRGDGSADGEPSADLGAQAPRNGRQNGDEPSGRRSRARREAVHGLGSPASDGPGVAGVPDAAAGNPVRSVPPRASGSRRRRAEDSSFHLSDLEIRPGSGGRRHRDDAEDVESGRTRRTADVADLAGAPTPMSRSDRPAEDDATGGRRRRRARDVPAEGLDGADVLGGSPRPGNAARNGVDSSRTDASRTDSNRAEENRAEENRAHPSRTNASRAVASAPDVNSTAENRTDRDDTDGETARERPGTTPSTSDDPTDFGENLGLGDLLAGALAAYRGL